jgi:hypothetical protein
MVKQYPHIIRIQLPSGNATKNASGDWDQPVGAAPAPVELPCRIETRSSVGYVKTSDGKMTEFQAIGYMPLPVPDIMVDRAIVILEGDATLFTSTVKHFSRGQLNARVWM